MISYTMLGTKNLEKGIEFYDALLAEAGASRMFQTEQMAAYGKDGKVSLVICLPFDGKAASVGNGTMIALSANDDDHVVRIYNKAIELGASDEGEPGLRAGGTVFAGYFRDIDGNKLNAICFK